MLILGDVRALDVGGGGGACAVAASSAFLLLVRPAPDGLAGRERYILRWSNAALPPLPPLLLLRGNAALVGVPERDLTRLREFVASRLALCSIVVPLLRGTSVRLFELLASWKSSATVLADDDDSAAAEEEEEEEEEEEDKDGVELLDLPRRMIDAIPLLPLSLLPPSLFLAWEGALLPCITRRVESAAI